MLMQEVEYVRPETLADAMRELDGSPDAKPLAGGQTLMNVMKLRLASPGLLVDLNALDELKSIDPLDAGVRIGAMATYSEIARHPLICSGFPIVADVADHIADRQVRNRGTIGGNCCFNDPTSNFPPLLTVLGASFEVTGAHGSRVVPVGQFFLGPYQTAVSRGELLQAVRIPSMTAKMGAAFVSMRTGEDGPAIIHVAALVSVEDGFLRSCRIAVGCVEQAPYRLPALESASVGTAVSPSAMAAMVERAMDPVVGITDAHGSARYREQMAMVFVRRALLAAIEDAGRTEQ
ncbi:MAG: FAD binding domain-containing protein [Bacilli bacterium]